MGFVKDLEFLHNLGLGVNIFGKDLERLFDGRKNCKIFVVVTRQIEDELYHPDILSEPEMTKLRNWIRCGDPAGLQPEWKGFDDSSYDAKVYLAGQDPGIDCTSVIDDMFVEEGGKKYTYMYSSDGIRKVSHPQDCLSLREHYLKLWRAAEDFSDLLVLNQKFLLGEIPETPYHCGPIDDETIPLVESLLRLHDFQLLTDNSQPYEHKRPFRLGDGWAEYEQRPYVSFTMSALPGWDRELLALLRHQPDILVQASTLYPYELVPGSDKQVVVSRDRIAKTTKDLRSTAWKPITMALTDVDISNEEFFCLDSLKRSKPVVFVVAAREWGPHLDLLGMIEDAAIDCGMPRMSRLRKHMAKIK